MRLENRLNLSADSLGADSPNQQDSYAPEFVTRRTVLFASDPVIASMRTTSWRLRHCQRNDLVARQSFARLFRYYASSFAGVDIPENRPHVRVVWIERRPCNRRVAALAPFFRSLRRTSAPLAGRMPARARRDSSAQPRIAPRTSASVSSSRRTAS